MTATAPDSVVDYLSERLDAEVVMPGPEEISRMPAQASRERYYQYSPEPLTPESILEVHLASERQKTVAVFNTVGRAQDAFIELRDRLPPDHRCLLLHSRFLADDRQAKEQEALRLLGAGSGEKVLLVSTQVVEVGLNISCENLLTEVAPASSLVQRAGRCARFRGEKGIVRIYEVPGDTARPFAPYLKDEAEATRGVLEARLGGGPVKADPAWERALVDEALGNLDKGALEAIRAAARASEVAAALSTDSRAAYGKFVRSVHATSVTIHSHPENLDLRRGIEVFGVSDPVLAGFLRNLDLEGTHKGYVLRPDWNDETSDDNEAPVVKRWVPVGSSDVSSAREARLLVIHPSVAAYDPELGLRLGEQGSWEAQSGELEGASKGLPNPDKPRPGESFRRHALDVARRARCLAETSSAAAVARLQRVHGLPAEFLYRLVELAGMLHDLGKLDRRWQRAIREEHLAAVGGTTSSADGEARLLAHSARQVTSSGMTRPRRLRPHAVSGACASYLILKEALPAMLGTPAGGPSATGTAVSPEGQSLVIGAALAAISRHHHPYSAGFEDFEPESGSEAELRALLAGIEGVAAPGRVAAIGPEDGRTLIGSVSRLVNPCRPAAWALYWTLVRLIRLADQASQRDLEAVPGGEPGSVLLSTSLTPPRRR